MTIKLLVNNQTIKAKEDYAIERNSGDLQIEFEFIGKMWENGDKILKIVNSEFEQTIENNSISIPSLYTRGTFFEIKVIKKGYGATIPTMPYTINIDQPKTLAKLQFATPVGFQVNSGYTTFIVNNRTIEIPITLKDLVVLRDTNSEIITFELPRYYDGVDLSQKNILVNFINADGKSGSAYGHNIVATDGEVSFTFDWTIDGRISVKTGKVQIALEFNEFNDKDECIYRWNTIPASFDVSNTIVPIGDAQESDYSIEKAWILRNPVSLTNIELKDTDLPIYINDKNIEFFQNKDLVVSRDTNAEILTFVIQRYIYGVDISNKIIDIKFINALGQGDRKNATNVVVDDFQITFGWVIDSRVSTKDGEVQFAIEVIGYDVNDEFYCWSTKPSKIRVDKGLFVDDKIDIKPDWVQWVEAEINRLQNIKVSSENIKAVRDNGNVFEYTLDGENWVIVSGGGGGTSNYDALSNRPQINGVILTGNKTSSDLGIKQIYTASDVGALPDTTVIPTQTSELINNGSDGINAFISSSVNNLINYYNKSETYTKNEIDNIVSLIPKFSIEIVDVLPTTNISTTTIYLILNAGLGSGTYDEFIYINDKWEMIGNTQVDLGNYYTKEESNAIFQKVGDYLTSEQIETLINSKVGEHNSSPTSHSDIRNDLLLKANSNLDNIDPTYVSLHPGVEVVTELPEVLQDNRVYFVIGG